MTVPVKIINAEEMKEKPNQEKVWDSISKPWKTYVIQPIPIITEFLEGKKGKMIDMGCGTGRNMLSTDLEYYCVDFSHGQLVHCKRNARQRKIKAKIFKQDISKLDKRSFKNKMFDYGLFISTIHCLDSPEKRINSLKEFYRVLKPKSEALISVWNSEDARFEGKKKNVYIAWTDKGIPYMRYYYLYTKRELLSLLRSVGFKIEEVYKDRKYDRFSRKNLVVRVRK